MDCGIWTYGKTLNPAAPREVGQRARKKRQDKRGAESETEGE